MSIIDDYADIARRMKRKPSEMPVEDGPAVCWMCKGRGWVQLVEYCDQAVSPPNLMECPHCHNPEGHPSP
jgi:RecJ-like exonuclease